MVSQQVAICNYWDCFRLFFWPLVFGPLLPNGGVTVWSKLYCEDGFLWPATRMIYVSIRSLDSSCHRSFPLKRPVGLAFYCHLSSFFLVFLTHSARLRSSHTRYVCDIAENFSVKVDRIRSHQVEQSPRNVSLTWNYLSCHTSQHLSPSPPPSFKHELSLLYPHLIHLI